MIILLPPAAGPPTKATPIVNGYIYSSYFILFLSIFSKMHANGVSLLNIGNNSLISSSFNWIS